MKEELANYDPSELEAAENILAEVSQAQEEYDAEELRRSTEELATEKAIANAARRKSDALDYDRIDLLHRFIGKAKDMHDRLKYYGIDEEIEAWIEMINNLKK